MGFKDKNPIEYERRKRYGFYHVNSSKKFSERNERTTKYYSKVDKSSRVIYQISSDGEIVKIWNNVREISEFFIIHVSNVTYYIKNKKIVGGCLFLPMMEYKSTTDYRTLIKILNKKLKKIS
jgi:hypothetical protein